MFGIVGSPWGSGILLLLLTFSVIVSGAFFQRRTFCRYLCFLGGLSANYSRTGMLTLRANTEICSTCTAKAACYNGTATVAACPLFSFPRTMDSSANCNLCANCIKACPNDAIMLTVRPPTKELWFLRTPKIEESFLAMAIMGIVIIQNVTMLGVWSDMLAWVDQTTGITSYPVIFTAVFAVGVSIPVALLALSAKVASLGNLENTFKNFARFGYALIPLDAAAHVAQPVPPARRGQLGVPHAISQFPWSPHAAVVLLAACDSDTAAGTDAVKLEGDPKAWPAPRLGVVPTGGGPRLHRAPCTAVA